MPKDQLSAAVGGSGEAITLVDHALILPRNGKGGFAVVDGQGAPVVDAVTFRKDGYEYSDFVDRDLPRKTRTLTGTYLYAGDYWDHFGHFIFESLARLWALDHVDEPLDGIIFLSPRRSATVEKTVTVNSFQDRLFRLLGIRIPLILIADPTEIDRLYVPRQGCGMGGLAAGTPAHRRFLQSRLRNMAAKPGVERLYLTRSNYGLRRGGIFGEGFLEQSLEAQGYAIYAPETATVEDQIATYLGARQIIAPDSSALHLFGFVGRADQNLAVVLRRPDGAKDLLPQITGFTGKKPLVVNCITRILSRNNARISSWGHFADLDFAALGAALHQGGYIDNVSAWPVFSDWRRDRMLRTYEQRLDCTLTELRTTGADNVTLQDQSAVLR